MLKKHLQVEDFFVKVRALQALDFALIARPEYMLEEDVGKILEATFSSSSDSHLKVQALQNMYENLLDAERQMGPDKTSNYAVNYSIEGGQSVPVAAGAGDANICGGIVQLYWDNILARCLDVNEHVRQPALKADCLAATALQLLLKLKRHLKIVYSLNDAHCQAFSPNEPLKTVEVLTKQNIPFCITEMRIDFPTTHQELMQRYQEDTVDYSAYTANIKRKHPAPRRGVKSGHMMGGDDDDEDWTGGRRQSNSGRRGNNSRGGRQQL